MIQRIQSLYLLAVAALMTTAIFTPLASFLAGVEEFELYAFELKSAEQSFSTMYMGIVVALSAIIPLITIFMYKKRLLQIRLCAVEIVMLLGSIAFMAIYYYLSNRMFSGMEFSAQSFRIAIVFPLVSLVLVYLSARAIFKDEMLVRSLDRIR